jgi:hypothetical protein
MRRQTNAEAMSDTTAGTPAQSSEAGRERSTPRRAIEWLANRNAFVVVGGFVAAGLLVRRVPALAPYDWVLFLTGGILPLVLATVSTAEDGHDADASNGTRVRFLVSQLAWAVTPWGILTQVLQLGGTALAYVRHAGRVPNREHGVPTTRPAPPFDGKWTIVNGGVTKPTSHSWGLVSQRYAYDFVVTDDEGETHDGDGSELAEYHAFGRPVRAPADGTVVRVTDGLRDHPHPGTGWLEWRTWRITGNHVVVRHAEGEYSLLAHLKRGSVRVEPGDEVERGDVLGACGNSGFSTEPHLHYQLQDHPNFWLAAGLVPRFEDARVRRDDDRRAEHPVYEPPEATQTGPDEVGPYLWAGDRVEPVEEVEEVDTEVTAATDDGVPTAVSNR